jgi:hypothetical protein
MTVMVSLPTGNCAFNVFKHKTEMKNSISLDLLITIKVKDFW